MQYLTYEEYTEIGGTLDLTAFKRNIDRACGYLDLQTFNRLREGYQSIKIKTSPVRWKELNEGIEIDIPINTPITVSDSVKACVRDLVEYLDQNVKNEKNVTSKSQSAGGVSESESYGSKSNDEIEKEMFCIVYDYLATETNNCGTPLMYRGAMR